MEFNECQEDKVLKLAFDCAQNILQDLFLVGFCLELFNIPELQSPHL